MNIARRMVGFLTSRGLVVATAESCTAGLIASTLAEVPGSGACLDVGFVVYSPTGKCAFLGVRPETIEQHGLTSEAVAKEMAIGTLELEACQANVTVANTGIADVPPDGSNVAPGTQCFAWCYQIRDERFVFSETKVFGGDRNAVRLRAALYAIERIEHYYDAIPVARRANEEGAKDGEQ